MQEWLNWQHWKCCVRETVPWVRIPPSPPERFWILDFGFSIGGSWPQSKIENLKSKMSSYQAPDAVQSRGCKPRQAGNGATVAVLGCAAASPEPDHLFNARLSRHSAQVPAPNLRASDRAGSDQPHAQEHAQEQSHSSRLLVHRTPRCRLNHDCAHPGQVAQLRDRSDHNSLRRVSIVH